MKVIVSNGSFRFHLSSLAAELETKGFLYKFFTAGYPTKIIVFFTKKISRKSYSRFLDRASDNISYRLVSADNFSEIFMRIGAVAVRPFSKKMEQRISVLGMNIYAFVAAIKIFFYRPDIYHYRDCYGGISVKVAQLLGVKTVCDHSIGHPFLIDYLTDNKGVYPEKTELGRIKSDLLPLSKRMYRDFNNNDTIIVNSDFVRETMIFCGVNPQRIKVVYQGVDSSFLKHVPNFNENRESKPNRILFAGGLQKRKGILELLEVLEDYDIDIDLAGGVDVDIASNDFFINFLAKGNVSYKGILARTELAALMMSHRIFIFTSYCEGSARVVFEALAAGLFVITTANSGSIVKHMENGLIIEPNNPQQLKDALFWTFQNPHTVDEIRRQNFDLIRKYYTQTLYCNNIVEVYKNILNQKS